MPEKNQQQTLQLAPNAMQLFDQGSTRYDVEVAQGVKPDALLDPAFWAHQAVKLRPMDEIRARALDGTWVANLLVLDTSRTWARVRLLQTFMLTDSGVAETQASTEEVKAFMGAHEVKYRGGTHKFSIIRKADGAVIEEGITAKGDAETKLEAIARMHVGARSPQAVAA